MSGLSGYDYQAGTMDDGSVEYWRGQAHYAHAQWKIYEGLCHALSSSANRLEREKAALEAERDALREATRWIPCAERLPAQGVRVLMVSIYDTVKIAYYLKEPKQWTTDDGYYYHGDNFSFVVGWLPLPEPPADGG